MSGMTDGDRIAAAGFAVLLALANRIAIAVALGAIVATVFDMLLRAPAVGVQIGAAALTAGIYLNHCARGAARTAVASTAEARKP